MLAKKRSFSYLCLALLPGLWLTSGTATAGINDLQGTGPGDLPNGGYFKAAEACATCHEAKDTQPPEYKEYMPFDTWAGTMMGNAARDPVFFAALSVANQDLPGMGVFCLRCHSPIGFVRGHATPPDGAAFDDIDKQGVGCDTCHRASTLPDQNDPDYPYYRANSQLLYTDDITETKHGPYSDASSPNHGTVQDLSLADSRFCGQCHEVSNPEVLLRDAAGAPTTLEFPLDTTYEEWESSAFGPGGASETSCIDCHMRRMVGDWPVANLFGAPLRTDPRDHALSGGNHWGILAAMEADPAWATANGPAFQLALGRTIETLESAAQVTVIDAPTQLTPGSSFDITVRVENLTGHKLPTGYAESRRAWIAVMLVGADGQERALLGGYDDITGEIQADPPTHVYRAVHGRWNMATGMGESEQHLALHDMILSDTRIPPMGFVPSMTTAPTPEIDYSDGMGGYRSYDEVTFTLAAPADAHGIQTLSARVYYQSMTREHIEFLKSENVTDTKGDELEAIYLATGEAPPILAESAEVTVDLGTPPGTGGGGGAGEGGSGQGGSGAGAAPGGGGDDGGCGCHEAGGQGTGGLTAAALAGLLIGAVARRRRARQG